ncbi:MAG: hypothetical protein ACE5HB_01515, partial [Terriglobia bacterium]
DYKDSARLFLDRADAYLLIAPLPPRPLWDEVSLKTLAARPVFLAWPGRLCTPSLLEFIRARLFSPGAG